MKKIIIAMMFIAIAFVLILAGGLSSCQTKSPEPLEVEDEDSLELKGTEWKLIGIVDTQTDILKELEPKDCDDCYSFTFDTDSTATGNSTSNILGVTLKPVVRVFLMTEALGTDFYLEDAILFREAIEIIISYERSDNELKFYYNDSKNYLKFKKIGG